MPVIVQMKVNGERRTAEVSGPTSLLNVLRERLELSGSKQACEQGECGSCSVILDGELVCSCLVMAVDCEGSDITTVEGLGDEDTLHAVQEALVDAGGVQCGFCTPGFAVAAAALFDAHPHPSADLIREELAGNICRCTGYGAILRALENLGAHP